MNAIIMIVGNCKRIVSDTPYIKYIGNEPHEAESHMLLFDTLICAP